MTAQDVAAHTAHAAKITARTLARTLPKGACYAVCNVHGERAGFMPLVDGDDVLTDKAKAERVIEVLSMTHAESLVSPRLIFVRISLAREWLAN